MSQSYMVRPLGLALALGLFPGMAWAELAEGAQLPDGSRKVGEHRYKAPSGYEETLKYYKVIYPVAAYPRRAIADRPGIRGVHLVNPGRRGFEGLNIYEANDEVRIYIVPEQEVVKPSKKKVTDRSKRR